ncbi:DUF3616 domain-containing protein [Methylocapsa acidiphila]|uniref:DUF3616 domain-containing protein n=1 Tax=Methylocapsa acidiphila TaxID=133552 RepID=UPI0018DDA4BF|nr:DUF3616 domain-containing protein [Methylocapsa acidiphila]
MKHEPFVHEHAEGVAPFKRPHRDHQLLVGYDGPARSRLQQGNYFEAELFAI